MTEIIYIATILYCIFVIDAVEGERIIAFIKDVFHINLTGLHQAWIKSRDSVLKLVGCGSLNFK